VPAFYDEGGRRHAKDLEFSLVSFERVKFEDKEGGDREVDVDVEEDRRHHRHIDEMGLNKPQSETYERQDRRSCESVVSRPLNLEDLFTRRTLTEGEPAQEIDKVLVFGYPGTGRDSPLAARPGCSLPLLL